MGVGAPYSGTLGLTISGDNLFCNTSNNFAIPDLPTGATIQWQATPNGVVIINSPSSPQTTLTKQTNGIITLSAVITNACGGPINISKDIAVGTPDRPKILDENGQQITSVSTCTYAHMQLCPQIDPKWDILEWEWEKVTGNFNLIDFESCAQVLGFQPGSGFISVRVRNTCGWSNPTLIAVHITDCSSMLVQQKSIKLFPNPATSSVTLSVDKTKGKENVPAATINEVKIYDNYGIVRLYRKFTKQQKVMLDLSRLPKGFYIVEVNTGSGVEYQQLIIQK